MMAASSILQMSLEAWAREDVCIWPDVSNCGYYPLCNAKGWLDGKYCMMSYVGRDYRPGGLVVAGMDHGDACSGSFAERRAGIEHWYQNGHGPFNSHFKGTVEVAAALFGRCKDCVERGRCLKSSEPSQSCVIDRIAQPNVVKCVGKVTDRTCKATATMFGNCAHHLVAELKVLRPKLAVFLGLKARWSVRNAVQPDVLHTIYPERIANRKGEPVLYEWPSLGAYLLFLYHPSSRGGLFRKEWDRTVVPTLNYLRSKGHMPL